MLKSVSSVTNAIGAVNYKGTWNASTNTPNLAASSPDKGDYYVVSVAGNTNLGGITTWYVGDWAVYNGSVWQRVEGGADDPAPSVRSNSTTGLMEITGPAAGQTRVMTIPDANFTAARTDAGQTFTGDQTVAGNVTLNAQGDLRFADADSSNYVAFQAPAAIASNVTWTLPSVDGASGESLTTNGTGTLSWASSSSGFDSGTVMLFAQTAAPTGWTKDTTNYNNSALRIVTGSASTGGSVDFTTAFASQTPSGTVSVSGSAGNTTLSTPQIPSHTHAAVSLNPGGVAYGRYGQAIGSATTGATGGGGAHSHPLTISSSTFSGNAINLAVKYVDVIRATKN